MAPASLIPSSTEPSAAVSGWRARLELGFEAAGGRTVLRHRRHVGPLRVQRVFYPEGAPCHSYLLHPPGGVVGGDRLEIEAAVGPGAHALITTPAAAKFYRSAGPDAEQDQCLQVASGATLEWLPALNILHGGARVRLRTRFELAPESRLLAWDLLGLGRPGSGDAFASGACDSRLEVRVDGRPMFLERLRLAGDDALREAPWGLQGRGYLATLLAWPATPETLATLRQQMTTRPGATFGCTLLPIPGRKVQNSTAYHPKPPVRNPQDPQPQVSLTPVSLTPGATALIPTIPGPTTQDPMILGPDGSGLLVCRWLADSGEALGVSMVEAWSLLRPLVLGREACPPRIWST